MISYLNVTIDELVSVFEDCIVYSDARVGRVYSAPYSAHEKIRKPKLKALRPGENGPRVSPRLHDGKWDDWDEEEEELRDEVTVDEDGRLHALSETLPFAAEALVGFLTDYIITDEMDDEWLTLDLARGALLGLRITLPSFDEIPEVPCVYRFRIERDARNGMPMTITTHALPGGFLIDSLERSDAVYEGVVSDESSLDELFNQARIPESERFDLGEAISEGVFHLVDEQCGIAFDVKKFRGGIMRLAARNRMHVVPKDTH